MKIKLNGITYYVEKEEDVNIEVLETVDTNYSDIMSPNSTKIVNALSDIKMTGHKSDIEPNYIINANMSRQKLRSFALHDINFAMEEIGSIIDEGNGNYTSITHKAEIVNGEIVVHTLYVYYNTYDCLDYDYYEVKEEWRNLCYVRYFIKIYDLDITGEQSDNGTCVKITKHKHPAKKEYIQFIESSIHDEGNREHYNSTMIERMYEWMDDVAKYEQMNNVASKKEAEKFARLYKQLKMPKSINPVIKTFADTE